MTSIIICTQGDVLLHKQGKLPHDEDFSESGFYYWDLNKSPKRLKVRDRLYFAVKGYIRGYCLIGFISFQLLESNSILKSSSSNSSTIKYPLI